jgi:K+-transporting ATPase KdpF subunit
MTVTLATLTGADVFGLIVSALVCAYLVYALLRGENL